MPYATPWGEQDHPATEEELRHWEDTRLQKGAARETDTPQPPAETGDVAEADVLESEMPEPGQPQSYPDAEADQVTDDAAAAPDSGQHGDHVEIRENDQGDTWYCVVNANGEELTTSEMYATRSNARRAAGEFAERVGLDVVDQTVGEEGTAVVRLIEDGPYWRWRVELPDGTVQGEPSGTFTSRDDAVAAAQQAGAERHVEVEA